MTPDDRRGRVMAVEENVFIGGSNELGAFESGVLGEAIGAIGAVVFGGVAVLAVVALWPVFFRPLAGADRFADIAPPSD